MINFILIWDEQEKSFISLGYIAKLQRLTKHLNFAWNKFSLYIFLIQSHKDADHTAQMRNLVNTFGDLLQQNQIFSRSIYYCHSIQKGEYCGGSVLEW